MDTLTLGGADPGTELATKVFTDPSKLRPLLNKECWRVFEKLRESPAYPAMLSKELSMNEQSVYYYVKQLKAAGLIEVEKSEERGGALAKYYSAPFDSFSIVPGESAKRAVRSMKPRTAKGAGTEFLSPFTKNGIFSAKIVVGSPDPHGQYKARARDGHLAAEFTAFVGANSSGFEFPLVFLDTMVKNLENENSNLAIIGGPVTNKLAEQANRFLPAKFTATGGNWSIESTASGKQYNDDSIGVIERLPHPYYKGKWILLLAGKRNSGTISAILALNKKTAKTIGKAGQNGFARIVEGLDLDGDGLIDDIEFKE